MTASSRSPHSRFRRPAQAQPGVQAAQSFGGQVGRKGLRNRPGQHPCAPQLLRCLKGRLSGRPAAPVYSFACPRKICDPDNGEKYTIPAELAETGTHGVLLFVSPGGGTGA